MAQLFGLPQPFNVHGNIHTAIEPSTDVNSAIEAISCGTPPSPGQWQSAFKRFLKMDEEVAAEIAQYWSLPLAMQFDASLGLGYASLLMECTDISTDAIDPGWFVPPPDYRVPADALE